MLVTENALAKMVPGKERIQVLDDKLTGFGVRVQSADEGGRKSFFFRAKLNGKGVFRALGEFPGVSVAEARDAAKTWAGKAAAWKQSNYTTHNPFEKTKRPESV